MSLYTLFKTNKQKPDYLMSFLLKELPFSNIQCIFSKNKINRIWNGLPGSQWIMTPSVIFKCLTYLYYGIKVLWTFSSSYLKDKILRSSNQQIYFWSQRTCSKIYHASMLTRISCYLNYYRDWDRMSRFVYFESNNKVTH